jgi:hypothetical protein
LFNLHAESPRLPIIRWNPIVKFPVETLASLNGVRWTREETELSHDSPLKSTESLRLFNIFWASTAFVRKISGT